MSDPFDKKLINRINEVFDNFEDDSAAEGWSELRKRFPEHQQRRRTGWWIGSAAAILILIGSWLFVSEENQPVVGEKVAVKPSVKKAIPENRDDHLVSINDNPEPPSEDIHSRKSATAQARRKYNAKQNRTDVLDIPRNTSAQNTAEPDVSGDSKPQEELTIIALSPHYGTKNSDKNPGSSSSVESSAPPNVIAKNTPEEMINSEVYPSEVATKKQLSDLISEHHDKPQSKKKVSVAVFAGSYFTYAEGSETSVNTGVGISSEVKLGRKVRLSTGVSIGQNSLKFITSIPQEATSNFDKTARNSHNYYELSNSPSYASSNPQAVSISSYNARLIGFDIPINLKFLLLQKKNTVYLSTGFSSNFFINESYTYDYAYEPSPSQKSYEQTTGRFQSFDFARVVNLSVGFEHSLSAKTKLSLEPFIKYPLSGLGSHDLRFGAAGMNLKFNFNR